MGAPTFSIAVPAFKKTFLQECIQSVLDQTCEDYELIIVNDNSPEDLDEIVHRFTDPRIIYRKNETGCGAYNVTNNWNKCLDLATGKYFMCIGDDDKLLPDCLEKYQSLIADFPDRHIFHAGTQLINEHSEIIGLQEARPLTESVYSMIWHRWCHSRKAFIGDYLFRTDVLRAMGGFIWMPYAWGSDEQTIFAVAENGGIVNMQGFGFQFRISTLSISGGNRLYKEKAEAWRSGKAWYRVFLRKEPADPTDKVFWHFIQQNFDWYFKNCYEAMIQNDFRDNGLKDFRYWMKNREQYDLTRRDIWVHLFLGTKQRIRK
jgi:glycosyltransferase involved in cell wall biosynthesis